MILITSVESSSLQYDVYFVHYKSKIEGMFYGLAAPGQRQYQRRYIEEANPLKHSD